MQIVSYFNIQLFPNHIKKFLYNAVILWTLSYSILNMTVAYQILFVYDKIGIEQAGIYLSVLMLTSFLLDYPTGSLSDWIGQKGVLILTYLTYTIGIIVFAFANSLIGFIISAIILGFSQAQLSGTIETWFDNNYKIFSQSIDKDKTVYKLFRARLRPIMTIGWTISVIIGGLAASFDSRQIAFVLEGFCSFLFIFIVYFLMNDYFTFDRLERKQHSVLLTIKISLVFISKKKYIFFLLVGYAIYHLGFLLWSEILLFVVYFGYAGSDLGTSMIRSFVGVIAIILFILVLGKIVSNVKHPWSFRYSMLLQMVLFFGGFILLLIFIPLTNTFNPIGIVSAIIISILSLTILNNVNGILYQQLMLEMIPSEIRNSVYSFQSSLKSIMASFMIPIMASIFASFGIIVALLIMFFTAGTGLVFIFLSSITTNLIPQREPIDAKVI